MSAPGSRRPLSSPWRALVSGRRALVAVLAVVERGLVAVLGRFVHDRVLVVECLWEVRGGPMVIGRSGECLGVVGIDRSPSGLGLAVGEAGRTPANPDSDECSGSSIVRRSEIQARARRAHWIATDRLFRPVVALIHAPA